MGEFKYTAIGVVEINFYSNAVVVLDYMLKSADVELIGCEKLLGGRMVTIVVGGSTSSVNASIEMAIQKASSMPHEPLKAAITIANPHSEIRKLFKLKDAKPKEVEPKEVELKEVESKEVESKEVELKDVKSKSAVEKKTPRNSKKRSGKNAKPQTVDTNVDTNTEINNETNMKMDLSSDTDDK